jgi:eukaryotic-like serine/threonine-protein kinase
MSALAPSSKFGAAELLVGRVLLNQWEVLERIRHDDGISGNTRSACYKAKSKDGTVAFVKAFDFRHDELTVDTDSLEKKLREFNYERKVHELCKDSGISRVTRIYEAGKIIIDSEAVHFIICEWLDRCLREHQPPGCKTITLEHRFLALRDTAAALSQLHFHGVAHQDVKPSNAVCTDTGILKLTDLGSSSCEKLESPPHDLQPVVGQPSYAPYELLYDSPSVNWERRRFGCDLFLLGNLCFTTIVGGSLTLLSMHCVPERFRYPVFTGDYNQVLPYLIEAHDHMITPIIEEVVPSQLSAEVIQIIKCLCHPDPTKRGHKKNLASQNNNPYGLERVISHFNSLAIKAKIHKL